MKEIKKNLSKKVRAGIKDGYTKTITRRMLAQYYYNCSVAECCHMLKINRRNFYKLLKAAKIELKGRGTTKKLKIFISDVPIDDQITDFHKDKYSDRRIND